MARLGSRRYREAHAAAATVAARPRPELPRALVALLLAADAARYTELAEWPPAARGALVAEIEHLRRVVELLPSLDESLRELIVARHRSKARDEADDSTARHP